MTIKEDNSFFVADNLPGESPSFSSPEPVHDSADGFTVIYRAARHGRIFALKALRPAFSASPLHRALLRKEYETAMGLIHPGILTVYSLEKVNGPGLCIVEEWIDGLTLDAFIASVKPSRRTLLGIFLSIAETLEYVHSRQTVHRDLKPANIIVTTTGNQPKIIDFGLADSPGIAIVKGLGGTDGYAAPEQYVQGAAVDHRADIYAFGRILSNSGAFPATAARCTAAEPDRRPASMAEVRRLLRGEYARRGRLMSVAAGAAILVTAAWLLWPASAPDGEPSVSPAPSHTPGASTDSVSTPAVTDADPPPPGKASPVDLPEAVPPAMTAGEAGTSVSSDSGEEADMPYSDRLRRAALSAAGRRFAAHIAMADTAGPGLGYRLYHIGYWRHLAKEDMRGWIEGNPDPDNPYTEDAAAVSRGIIDEYSRNHINQHKAGLRRIEDRIGPNYVLIDRYITDELDDGSLEMDTLGEDNRWHSVVIPPQGRRH